MLQGCLKEWGRRGNGDQVHQLPSHQPLPEQSPFHPSGHLNTDGLRRKGSQLIEMFKSICDRDENTRSTLAQGDTIFHSGVGATAKPSWDFQHSREKTPQKPHFSGQLPSISSASSYFFLKIEPLNIFSFSGSPNLCSLSLQWFLICLGIPNLISTPNLPGPPWALGCPTKHLQFNTSKLNRILWSWPTTTHAQLLKLCLRPLPKHPAWKLLSHFWLIFMSHNYWQALTCPLN